MGFIYLATSPSGNSYVGQTNGTIKKRWAQHITEANSGNERGCRRLNEAIRKYGGDNFALLECWECPEDDLDEWEILFVDLFNTLHPMGYNLTQGGQSNRGIYSDDTRTKMSEAKRFNIYGSADLPAGVTYVKADGKEGFRVRHGIHHLRVMGDHMTMDEKLTTALDLYQKARNGTLVVEPGRTKSNALSAGLPTYMSYSSVRGCYSVQKPGYPRKSFGAQRNPESAKQQALDYLNQLQ